MIDGELTDTRLIFNQNRLGVLNHDCRSNAAVQYVSMVGLSDFQVGDFDALETFDMGKSIALSRPGILPDTHGLEDSIVLFSRVVKGIDPTFSGSLGVLGDSW